MSGRPRIVCVGANLESRESLLGLLDCDANIVGLVTLPESSAASVSDFADLTGIAHENSIPTIITTDINSKEVVDLLLEYRADYMFVLGWSQILREDALASVSEFVVGSHPTPLPKRRGRAPIPWTILHNEDISAVSLFRMNAGIDDGPILLQKYFDIPVNSNSWDLYSLVSSALCEAFQTLYQSMARGETVEIIQIPNEVSYRGRRVPEDGLLNFNLTTLELDSLVRASTKPFPGAYFYYRDIKITVWESTLYDGCERVGIPGQIMSKTADGLIVRAADDCVILKNLSSENSRVPLTFFRVGDVLNYRVTDEVHRLRSRLATLEAEFAALGKSDE